MLIKYEDAVRLFKEANDWTTGRTVFIAKDSEIRKIAKDTFNESFSIHMMYVCSEIFRVIAERAMAQEEVNA